MARSRPLAPNLGASSADGTRVEAFYPGGLVLVSCPKSGLGYLHGQVEFYDEDNDVTELGDPAIRQWAYRAPLH
jgi:hypothetical protein